MATKRSRKISNIIYLIREFEPARFEVYEYEKERLIELQKMLLGMTLRTGESCCITKVLHGDIDAKIQKEKIDLGFFGWEDWRSYIDGEDFLTLSPVYFSSEFLYQLGPESGQTNEGKERIKALIRKKDKELLVWGRIES